MCFARKFTKSKQTCNFLGVRPHDLLIQQFLNMFSIQPALLVSQSSRLVQQTGGFFLVLQTTLYHIATNMQYFGCETRPVDLLIQQFYIFNIAGSSCGLPIQPTCVADRRRALATSGAILAERRSAELPSKRFRDPQERQESSLGQGGFFKRLLNAGKLETLFCHSLALLELMQFTTFGFLGLKSIYFITRPIKQSFHKKVSQ